MNQNRGKREQFSFEMVSKRKAKEHIRKHGSATELPVVFSENREEA